MGSQSYIFRKTPDGFHPTFINILYLVSQNASPLPQGVNFDRGEEVSVGVNSPPVSSCLVNSIPAANEDEDLQARIWPLGIGFRFRYRYV